MPASRDGGVRKQSTGYYHQSVQKLQAVVEAKLKEVAVLDAAREQMAEREQVLVDLVLQQEHHLSHLEQMKAALDADMASLDMLLSMDANASDAAAATAAALSNRHSSPPADAARSVGNASTESAAACSTGIAATPCSGTPLCFGTPAVAPALHHLQAWQQPQLQVQGMQQPQQQCMHQTQLQPQLQLQVQQWQQGSTVAGSECGSDNTPMGAAVSTALGSSRQQYVQGLLQAATDLDWARAMAMSSDDWCAYQQRLITRLRTLLQLTVCWNRRWRWWL